MFRSMFPIALAALALFTATASAQGITIDDDGWSRSSNSGSQDFMVDIDDDAFARMEKPGADMREPYAASGCHQLEMQMGMAGGDCGQMTKAAVASSYIGAHD